MPTQLTRKQIGGSLAALGLSSTMMVLVMALRSGARDAAIDRYWVIPEQGGNPPLVLLRIGKARAIAAPLDRSRATYRREFKIVELKDGVGARMELFPAVLRADDPVLADTLDKPAPGASPRVTTTGMCIADVNLECSLSAATSAP
jgi:hypothetical protein